MGAFQLLVAILSSISIVFGSFDDHRCGPFQYYNSTLDANHLPPSIHTAVEQLDNYLELLAEAFNSPSLSFGVVYNQELIYYKSIGYADLKTKKPPTPDTIYRIGSISKVWTVLMAYALRDRPHTSFSSFEETIHSLDPRFEVANPWGITEEERRGATLTVQHLASQTSGLPREAPCNNDEQDDCFLTTQEIFRRLSSDPSYSLIHPTDVQPSYSNLAFAILGNVLTEYHNYASFNESLFDLLISPMGLRHTGLYLSQEQKKSAATGYYEDGSEAEYTDIAWVGPAGQLFSSVSDLAALMKQYFAAFPSLFQTSLGNNVYDNVDFVVSPQTLREMLRPAFMTPDQQTGFGSPFELQWVQGHLIRSKGGNVDGFSSQISMVPEMKLGVVVLINRSGADEFQFALRALQLLIPAFEGWMQDTKYYEQNPPSPSAQPNRQLIPSETIQDIVGFYDFEGITVLHIYVEETTNAVTIASIAPLTGVLGWLIWKADDLFYFHDRIPHLDMCWDLTLNALDGSNVRFERDDESGTVTGLAINGPFPDIFFDKETNSSSHEGSQDATKTRLLSKLLRSNHRDGNADVKRLSSTKFLLPLKRK